jgi:hypothetical protein
MRSDNRWTWDEVDLWGRVCKDPTVITLKAELLSLPKRATRKIPLKEMELCLAQDAAIEELASGREDGCYLSR